MFIDIECSAVVVDACNGLPCAVRLAGNTVFATADVDYAGTPDLHVSGESATGSHPSRTEIERPFGSCAISRSHMNINCLVSFVSGLHERCVCLTAQKRQVLSTCNRHFRAIRSQIQVASTDAALNGLCTAVGTA